MRSRLSLRLRRCAVCWRKVHPAHRPYGDLGLCCGRGPCLNRLRDRV